MSGQASAREQRELLLLLANDKKLQKIHALLFLPPHSPRHSKTLAEKAYPKHLARLKKLSG